VRPRDTVLVMGIGGVGINAVQGAAHAGAAYVVAVDPIEFKRETALRLGATHAFASVAEAMPFLQSVTNGQGADASIVTVGRVESHHIGEAFQAIRKAGRCAVASVGQLQPGIDVHPMELVLYAKTLQGVLFGNANLSSDIPRLLEYYRSGHLRLEELITNRYSVDQVADAYADMYAGRNIRGVVVHQH
jgi:Zn-dependent alcohol dehydrogenase